MKNPSGRINKNIVLYCIVLYCIVLYCIVLLLLLYCYCIVLYCHCIVIVLLLYCIVLYCIVLYCIVLYCIVLLLYCIVIVLYCIKTVRKANIRGNRSGKQSSTHTSVLPENIHNFPPARMLYVGKRGTRSNIECQAQTRRAEIYSA